MFQEIRSLSFFSFKELCILFRNKIFKSGTGLLNLSYTKHVITEFLKQGGTVVKLNDGWVFKNCNGLIFHARMNSSDLKVFRQVWLKEEYKPVLDFLKKRGIAVKTIIDCGANVGYTSLYFSYHFQKVNILSVEADKNNAIIMFKNIRANSNACIKPMHKAIWYRDAFLKINKKTGDCTDWAFAVEETSEKKDAEVEGISITDIAYDNSWPIIDLLKIDIEGAERYLFQNEYHKTFLPRVKCLVMEIHDEYKIRQLIYSILRKENFEWIDAGELTIAANHNLC